MFRALPLSMNRLWLAVASAAAATLLFAGVASAHVTVNPGESAPGAWQTYTIKVPVEKDIPTVKVALKIPDGVEFKQYRPIPDWDVELTKNDAGAVTAVTWTAEGDGIGPGEFQQFDFVAKNPDKEAEVAWDAFQYYNDGSVVEWTGGTGADYPHSLTVISAAAGDGATADAGHGHDASGSSATGGEGANGAGASDADGGANGDGAGTGASGGGTNGTGNAAAGNAGTQSGNSGADATAGAANSAAAQGAGTSGVETATLVVSIAALIVSLAALWLALRSARKSA
ncbi:YcnI family protein [Paenibacillus macerans]|uniref:YcnI family copper-binding membrane protein n=1 Tax=Paenibacillus macerans TaxID=44252 RepID=UPI00203CE811|nr:YcnI family protein [Paenibacillus macerans]MCM3701789.1 YcnI family protein [Paenibacillus macerans]